MAVEAFVLGGNGRRDQDWGDLVERHIRASSCVGIENLVQHVPIAVQDAGGLELRGAVLQVRHAGQGTGNGVVGEQQYRSAHEQQEDATEQGNDHGPYQTATVFRTPACCVCARCGRRMRL